MTSQPTAKSLRSTLALLALVSIGSAGCGANPTGVDQYGNPISDPYGTGGYSDPYGSGSYGSGSSGIGSGYSDPYGGGSSYGQGSSYGSGSTYGGGSSYTGGYATSPAGVPGTGVPVPGAELKVGKVNKDIKGFWLWKTMTCTGQITNPTSSTLSGEIQLSFMKNKKVVETQYEFVTDLAPGQSHSFSVKSKKACDDVEVSVESKPGVTPGTSTTPGYGTGTGYGTTPGYGTGTGYDSGYGSTTGGYPSTGGSYPTSGGGYPPTTSYPSY